MKFHFASRNGNRGVTRSFSEKVSGNIKFHYRSFSEKVSGKDKNERRELGEIHNYTYVRNGNRGKVN